MSHEEQAPWSARPNTVLAGSYRLETLIGRGGMGAVWRGRHLVLGNKVACKFLDAGLLEREDSLQRFRNEAQAAAALKSKHVVRVYDYGVADGRPYIVMEYLEGESLEERLARRGHLSPEETAHIIHQVCRALKKAHSHGIVHRDLKPDNIFLAWDDEDKCDVVKVLDFGIAKVTDDSRETASMTRTGWLLGTPGYMSPEQARGRSDVGYRSDLWALGVVAFQCMTGRLPFDGEAAGDLLVKICTAPVPFPSSINPQLSAAVDEWTMRVLQRDRFARFESAEQMSRALSVALGLEKGSLEAALDEPSTPTLQLELIGAGPSLQPSVQSMRPEKRQSRDAERPWMWIAAGCAAALALASAIVTLSLADGSAEEPASPVSAQSEALEQLHPPAHVEAPEQPDPAALERASDTAAPDEAPAAKTRAVPSAVSLEDLDNQDGEEEGKAADDEADEEDGTEQRTEPSPRRRRAREYDSELGY